MPGLAPRPWLPSLVYFRPSSSVFTRYTPVPRFHLLRPGSCSLALVRSLAPLLKRRTRGLALRRRSEPLSSSAGLADSLCSGGEPVSSSAGLADSLCSGGPSPSPQAPDSRTRSAAAALASIFSRSSLWSEPVSLSTGLPDSLFLPAPGLRASPSPESPAL